MIYCTLKKEMTRSWEYGDVRHIWNKLITFTVDFRRYECQDNLVYCLFKNRYMWFSLLLEYLGSGSPSLHWQDQGSFLSLKRRVPLPVERVWEELLPSESATISSSDAAVNLRRSSAGCAAQRPAGSVLHLWSHRDLWPAKSTTRSHSIPQSSAQHLEI